MNETFEQQQKQKTEKIIKSSLGWVSFVELHKTQKKIIFSHFILKFSCSLVKQTIIINLTANKRARSSI